VGHEFSPANDDRASAHSQAPAHGAGSHPASPVPGTAGGITLHAAGIADPARLLPEAPQGSRSFDPGPAPSDPFDAAPERFVALRAQAREQQRRGDLVATVLSLRSALRLRPDDAELSVELSDALRASGDMEGAIAVCLAATERAPTSKIAWYGLATVHAANACPDQAKSAYERALDCDPAFATARGALGDVLRNLGDLDAAVSCYRTCLTDRGYAPRAWFQLANIKIVPLSVDDVSALRRLHEDSSLSDSDRVFVGYALSKALEDQRLYRAAFPVLVATNRLARRRAEWDARAFSREVDAIDAAFAKPIATAADAHQGSEVIFLVSMPRSGSTLVEQILSAHPEVEGSGELPDLNDVLLDESKRRRRGFPDWVADASPTDWRRLGEDYLARTARWCGNAPRFTDKSLLNWPLVGAAAAMLPGARFIDCRRDPVETCLACFRQLFAFGNFFSYDLDELAAYWRDYDRLSRAWRVRHPDRFFVHVYEDLLREPETQTRRLLAFLDLPFDPACLEFHRSSRAVRTFSAGQVRQPLQRDTARAHLYGSVLHPLRTALARTDRG
jgi:tetratricopeptide (TPR) repeat protein